MNKIPLIREGQLVDYKTLNKIIETINSRMISTPEYETMVVDIKKLFNTYQIKIDNFIEKYKDVLSKDTEYVSLLKEYAELSKIVQGEHLVSVGQIKIDLEMNEGCPFVNYYTDLNLEAAKVDGKCVYVKEKKKEDDDPKNKKGLYLYKNNTWIDLSFVEGQQGPAGKQGIPGENGEKGEKGDNATFNVKGKIESQGDLYQIGSVEKGDAYLYPKNGKVEVYIYVGNEVTNTSDDWICVPNLTGPQGPQGESATIEILYSNDKYNAVKEYNAHKYLGIKVNDSDTTWIRIAPYEIEFDASVEVDKDLTVPTFNLDLLTSGSDTLGTYTNIYKAKLKLPKLKEIESIKAEDRKLLINEKEICSFDDLIPEIGIDENNNWTIGGVPTNKSSTPKLFNLKSPAVSSMDGLNNLTGVAVNDAYRVAGSSTESENGIYVCTDVDKSTEEGTTYTWLYVGNIAKGEDGTDGVGIQSIALNDNKHLIITKTDGTTIDLGLISKEITSLAYSPSENNIKITYQGTNGEEIKSLPFNIKNILANALGSTGLLRVATDSNNEKILSIGGLNESDLPITGVDTKHLADSAVETGKINDGAVTTNKIADEAITTSKIADGNVTAAKLGSIVNENNTTVKIFGSAITLSQNVDDGSLRLTKTTNNETTLKITDLPKDMVSTTSLAHNGTKYMLSQDTTTNKIKLTVAEDETTGAEVIADKVVSKISNNALTDIFEVADDILSTKVKEATKADKATKYIDGENEYNIKDSLDKKVQYKNISGATTNIDEELNTTFGAAPIIYLTGTTNTGTFPSECSSDKSYHTLMCLNAGSGKCRQILLMNNKTTLFTREYSGTAWGSWVSNKKYSSGVLTIEADGELDLSFLKDGTWYKIYTISNLGYYFNVFRKDIFFGLADPDCVYFITIDTNNVLHFTTAGDIKVDYFQILIEEV